MPRFSVIVPAFKVQAYLHECLDSVLTQTYDDLELIAVDDCSPDACGSIIDEVAARDQRVQAVHLPENAGLGPARNAGLARASGDYVIFLDGDDTLVPGALRAMADRLKETDTPDVLVYDYARTYWTGEVVPNQFAAQLTEQGPPAFRLTDRPGLLKLLMVVWNKAYKREFIEREGFAFPPGYYEDTPWTYPALLAASSITTLDRVCVHYRQRRQGGNILATTSRKHFDIFDQYDRVFAFLADRPALAHWKPVLFRRMIDHFSTLATTRGRLPRGSRAEFFRRARAHCRRYRAPGAAPGLRARLRHSLIRLGCHRTYRALWSTDLLRARARRTAGAGLRVLRAGALRLHYRIQLRLPVRKNLAVFSAYWNRGYSCNPAAIEAKVRELAPHIRTAWISDAAHHHTVPAATRRLHPGTFGYWTALARAGYLVNNVNFDRRLVKRPGQIMLQTHHGTPLKTMGLDLQEHPAAGGSMDFAQLLANADKWDYSLSANRHSTLVWERVYPSACTTLEYGYPRNDVFQRATTEDVARLRASLSIPEGSVAVLYAPTHRDYRRTQRAGLDLERLAAALGPRFVLLTRAHYFSDTPLTGEALPRIVDVSGHHSVESLCLASDALLTDYSSLMFDYANLDRPIVVHTDDWEAYEAARGTYFDVRDFPPGAVAATEDELIDVFTSGHWRGSRSAQLRAAFRKQFCLYDDGQAAERVVRRVFLNETAGLPAFLPSQERTPAPAAAVHIPHQPEAPQIPAGRVPVHHA
ncbi:bifunctional glycosyltransferase family 2 protein/CDP-glycerol:glycerophosphate glycerophosphotransferase [Streptomyces sp. NBC_01142]|uniref:bifunctional glycosyltransferase/CDP-glycerol:glycerophosphate glycerophosphotransferase n=1 Tax=Streptomyces sp. NBC_01142 TaxID=2975865 RepID=UPI00225B3799|nr:bifunctional glycosyltransferase family 2 protein/CDP-glycerol:glycerophosphate glycerophosphotransferase [Streptomyces sp. NBC_01142]MCX4823484.1 bifunctional glycosyltransferase family 2 protein/CDP-glycerol:glycerophosphate glycerophosphotransferase [Streptomyces sp. NBC_01142]